MNNHPSNSLAQMGNRVSLPSQVGGKMKTIKSGTSGVDHVTEHIQFIKLEANAIIPNQETIKSGSVIWKMGITKREHNRAEDPVNQLSTFNTSLRIIPPCNQYIEITGDDQLLMNGYMLPSPIIIDSTNCDEEIIVKLLKFRDAEELTIPGPFLNVVIRPAVHGGFDETKQQAMYAQFDQQNFNYMQQQQPFYGMPQYFGGGQQIFTNPARTNVGMARVAVPMTARRPVGGEGWQ